MEQSGHPWSLRSLERVSVRMRENTVTQSAWRMIAGSEGGEGVITLIEGADGVVFRGEGIFLGKTQQELRDVYDRLNSPTEEPAFEIQQLG